MNFRTFLNLSIFLLAQTTIASTLAPQDLVGTWSLVSFRTVQQDGSEADWCFEPQGLLIYTGSGYMSVGINCGKKIELQSPSREVSDRLLYSGRYSVDVINSTVIHHVANSNLDKFLGKDLVRSVSLHEDELTLATVGGEFNNILKWKKLVP